MKDFIEFIARALVDHPNNVEVSEVEGEKTTVYELRVAPEDLGKVIGRKGQHRKTLFLVFLVELFESCVLVGKTASTRRIDHQQHFALERGQRNRRSVNILHCKIIQGRG